MPASIAALVVSRYPGRGFPYLSGLLFAGLAMVLSVKPAAAQIMGSVVAADGGAPIAGAVVSVQGTDVETTSGADGSFALGDASGPDLVVVAGAVGFFYGSATVSAPKSGVILQLDGVPLVDDPTYRFSSAEQCARCHAQQYDEWRGSPMSNAGVNTWVYDIYDGTGTEYGDGGFVYTRDSVVAEHNPNSECAACHQPEPWAASPGVAMDPLGSDSPGSLHGVSCDMCHRIANVDASRPNFPGIHPETVRLTRPDSATWVVMYGSLGDVNYHGEGEMRASYQPQMGAELCATCHQDKNDPDGDGNFEEDDGIVSEPTFVEWRDSAYADPDSAHFATCADCHMAPTTAADACTVLDPSIGRPEGEIRSHRILGTTAEFLENSVTMTMDVSQTEDALAVTVDIVNDRVGHHVPTGVTIRNMILVVEAMRTQDGATLEHLGSQVVHDLGGVGDPAEGYYAGLPGKLYGKINQAENGTSPTFFTDAIRIVTDNRIPALGSDRTEYAFRIPEGGGDLRVRARLIYRRSWRALTDAKHWTEDGHGEPLADVAAPHFGHLMEEATETVGLPYTPTPSCDGGACPDGGLPTAGDDDGCGCRIAGLPGRGAADGRMGLAARNQSGGNLAFVATACLFGLLRMRRRS